jgi:hypothetical protein
MWWFYIHSMQFATLWASYSFLPHYTVAFKPLFEFIVLGAIPGTDFEIGYMTSLIIAACVLLLILLRKQILLLKNVSIHHQNQVQA